MAKAGVDRVKGEFKKLSGNLAFFEHAEFREGENLTQTEGSESVKAVVAVLKVSAQSKPKAVAGALAAVLRDSGRAEMQAVGAGAVNQAVKAIAIARGFVAPNGIDVVAIPGFQGITIDGDDRTAIRFLVEPR